MKLEKKNYRKIIVGGMISVGIISTLLINKNETLSNINISQDTISNNIENFETLAMYKNDGSGDTPITTMPESGYIINTKKSYCTTDNINKVYDKMYTDENGQHVITGLSKDDKCYLYFNKIIKGSAELIKSLTVKESPESFTGVATTDEGVFKAQDDDGDTYYWRGAVTNNYVKFGKWSEDTPDVYCGYYSSTSAKYKEYSSLEACQSAYSYNVNCTKISKAGKDMYWRIIRINGDGTIRIIYDGDTPRANGSSLTVDNSNFNSGYFNNKYVGFQYKSGDVHGYGTEATNSTILDSLNSWYTTNLDKLEIKEKIDINAGFCNDRDPYTDKSGTTSGGGTGTTTTYYGAYIRLFSNHSTNATPTFKCKNSSDLFTKSGAVKKDGTANGNRALTNPIGLITADEVVYAGGFEGRVNSSYYLYTGFVFWTLSPYNCSSNFAGVFAVHSDGSLDNGANAISVLGVRPVINLRSDVTLTGTGTASDPYIVQ